MPEIKHTNEQSIPGPSPAAAKAVVDPASAVAQALEASNVKTSDLEAAIAKILAKRHAAAVEAAKPKEPDWTKVTEKDYLNPAVYIPVIEHEVPAYMDMKLKDKEYEVVWGARDQRRYGQLIAMGYEPLRKEHVDPNFLAPLPFDSEGNYIYMDTIAMRVHKRILYGKRMKALQVSLNQLSNRNRPPRVRVKDTFGLSEPVSPTVGDFYEPSA